MGKKKRYIGIGLLLLIVFLGAFSCERTEEHRETETEESCERIVVTYQTLYSSRTEDLDLVVEKINALSREKIGVEIELLTVDAIEAPEKYSLWLTQGRRIDLMVLNYQDISTYVDQSMVLPLNDLLEVYGEQINQISEEWENLYSGTTINQNIYGVEVVGEVRGDCKGLWIPKRYLEEADFHYEANHIYSFEELSVLFERLKKRYPEKYPLGQISSAYNFSSSMLYLSGANSLGSSLVTGILDKKSEVPELMDYYESEQYKNWLDYIRQWYLAGYIYPEAATTSLAPEELLKAGIIMSIPQSGAPFMYTEEMVGEEMVCLRLSAITYSPRGTTGAFWTIPPTAQEPEAAMKFLNLMYSDPEIVNLFSWGIEGVHYRKVGEDNVVYPEGKNADTVGYHNPMGLYGDQRLRYTYGMEDRKKLQRKFSEAAVSDGMEYAGFHFDTAVVASEMIQVQKVLERYLYVLESGSADIDTLYPEFVEKLKYAGIETIVSEKQRQLDAWLSDL